MWVGIIILRQGRDVIQSYNYEIMTYSEQKSREELAEEQI
jgi:hypothetical protein